MTCYALSFGSGSAVTPDDMPPPPGLMMVTAPALGADLTAPGDVTLPDGGSWLEDGQPVPPAELSYRLRAVRSSDGSVAVPETDGLTLTLDAAQAGVELSFEITARRGAGPWSGYFPVGTRSIGNGASGPGATVNISHNGATFTITDVTAQGVHDDGSPWVVASGGTITQVMPASAELTRDSYSGTYWSHGLMHRAGRADTQGTLAEMQAANSGHQPFVGQGYDALNLNSYSATYDHARNIDPGATGAPVVAQPGVYTKAVSKLSGNGSTGRPVLDDIGVLTVYAAAPAIADGFRPGYASDGTDVPFGPADLDMSHLLNLPMAGAAGSVPTYAEAMALLDQVKTEQHTYGPQSENIQPTDDALGGFFPHRLKQATYNGDTMETVSTIMLALNYDAYSITEKRDIAARIVQYAIDVAARAQQGGIWQDNGGHCHGRKEVLAFAARLTGDHPAFTGPLAYTTTRHIDPALASPAPIWGTERQIFAVTQADIDLPGSTWAQSELGYPEWQSDATRNYERNDNLTERANGYRHIIARAGVPFALALRMMGAHGQMSQTWLDYQDRHMALRSGLGEAVATNGNHDIEEFARWAWTQDRAGLGGVWTPPVTTPTAVSIDEPALPVWDSNPHGTGSAIVRMTGTHDGSTAADLEYRITRVSDGGVVVGWTAFSAANSWTATASVAPSFEALRAEVRSVADTGLSATQTGRFFAGYIVGYMGQSLAALPITSDVPATFTPPADRLWLLYSDENGTLANGPEAITAASNLGPRRMAAVVDKHSNAPVMLVDMTDSGTSRRHAADDALTTRDWARTIGDPVAYVQSRGSDCAILFEAWFTDDAATRYEFERIWAPFYLNQQVDGLGDTGDGSGVLPYSGGNIAVRASSQYTAQHHLYDLTESSGKGQGLFDPARTVWVPSFGASHIKRDSDPAVDGEIKAGDLQKAQFRGELEELAEGTNAFSPIGLGNVAGWTGQRAFGGHMAWPEGTHVSDTEIDGESLSAVSYMQAMLRALGLIGAIEPRVTGVTWHPNGLYADVTIALPHGGTLSTAHIEHAAGAYAGSFEATNWITAATTPAALRELHEVQGFTIRRNGAGTSIFGDFSAIIHDAATGIVRITPVVPFANGDTIGFGFGDGFHLLTRQDILDGLPHQRLPIETHGAHVSGAGYGYPVVREPQFPVLRNDTATFTAIGITGGSAPVVTAPLADRVLTEGDADVVIDLNTVFSGATSYALDITGGPVSISGSDLVISAVSQAAQATYTITAGNSFGTATDALEVTVNAAASGSNVAGVNVLAFAPTVWDAGANATANGDGTALLGLGGADGALEVIKGNISTLGADNYITFDASQPLNIQVTVDSPDAGDISFDGVSYAANGFGQTAFASTSYPVSAGTQVITHSFAVNGSASGDVQFELQIRGFNGTGQMVLSALQITQ